jgi:hypothetical protein
VSATRLAPAQWRLLIRAVIRNAPINDVRSWMWASDADPDHLSDLQDRGLIVARLDGDQQPLRFANGQPLPGYQVKLTPAGRTLTVNQIHPQYRILRHLANFRHTRHPLTDLFTSTDMQRDLDTLRALDEHGLIEVFNRPNTGNPVPLASIRLADILGITRTRIHLYVSITAAGRSYTHGEDLY